MRWYSHSIQHEKKYDVRGLHSTLLCVVPFSFLSLDQQRTISTAKDMKAKRRDISIPKTTILVILVISLLLLLASEARVFKACPTHRLALNGGFFLFFLLVDQPPFLILPLTRTERGSTG